MNNFQHFNDSTENTSGFKKSNKIEFEEIVENEEYNEEQEIEEYKNKQEIILLRAVKKKKNRYVFQLLPDKVEFTRKLTDIYWLQNSLKAEFPYYYVI